MKTTVENIGNVSVMTLHGDHLDACNAGYLEAQLLSRAQAHNRVVLDMSQVLFVEGSGVGTILNCLRRVEEMGGDLKLCGVSKEVLGLFKLVRMHRLFDILKTREDAVKAFRGGSGILHAA